MPDVYRKALRMDAPLGNPKWSSSIALFQRSFELPLRFLLASFELSLSFFELPLDLTRTIGNLLYTVGLVLRTLRRLKHYYEQSPLPFCITFLPFDNLKVLPWS